MTPETLATPDMSRFVNNANDLVSFEAVAICGLCLYILILQWGFSKERKEATEANKSLAVSMATLAEAVRNVKK